MKTYLMNNPIFKNAQVVGMAAWSLSLLSSMRSELRTRLCQMV